MSYLMQIHYFLCFIMIKSVSHGCTFYVDNVVIWWWWWFYVSFIIYSWSYGFTTSWGFWFLTHGGIMVIGEVVLVSFIMVDLWYFGNMVNENMVNVSYEYLYLWKENNDNIMFFGFSSLCTLELTLLFIWIVCLLVTYYYYVIKRLYIWVWFV